MRLRKVKIPAIALALLIVAFFIGRSLTDNNTPEYSKSVMDVPAFSGIPYVVINNNEPEFTEKDITDRSYEFYSELDSFGRCGYVMACIGYDLMPTEDRGSIGQIKPTGWKTVKYDFVDGKYLYNRCHLIGYQLSGENANEKNLITGTRFLNVEGMLPFENMIADYVKETKNHVMYRVTPIFDGDNLLARGVQMEAWSVEDKGAGICFHIYAYNAQPGVEIDYSTGESWEDDSEYNNSSEGNTYILNTNSRKFHTQDCPLTDDIRDNNKKVFNGAREALEVDGYAPCKSCNP